MKSVTTLACTVATTLCLVLTGGCAGPEEYRRPGCNVILISIDTLRSDRLGCYGYTRDTSPNIDRFRADGALFGCTIAQAPSTMPSHASIFTSLIPIHHGAFISRTNPLPDSCTTMAELLQQTGYRTVSFNDGGQISAEFGFDQGFDRYETRASKDRDVYDFINTVNQVEFWLGEEEVRPFFLFLHTYQTHHPYTPDKRYLDELGVSYSGCLPDKSTAELLRKISDGRLQLTREDEEHFSSLYDAEIRQMDHAFGRLVELLKVHGLYEDSLIIVTSDHGEELGEHGCWGWHSHSLYEELLRVPLIIKFPGNEFAGAEIEHQVRSLDILPTILDVSGMDQPEFLEGRSLLPPLLGEPDEARPALSQIDQPRPMPATCLRSAEWKYYPAAGTYHGALYHIESDPGEEQNLVFEERQQFREMSQQFDRLLDQRPIAEAGSEMELSTAVTDQLRELGYIE